ncbi:MAG TPA: SIMPL domain-containing protein [Candidatus Dormibacteraeota bacterium]|nr:SIMPL domain-containing protein [Candidatus Dormibacteraeota bacterium]
MHSTIRLIVVSAATVLVCAMVTAGIVTSNRQPVLLNLPSATVSPTSIETAILTSGDASVSKKPDLAIVSAGIQSQQSTASAAQGDLAAKASKLIARIKSLGVGDSDLSTSGYYVGPMYSIDGGTITGYRAYEQLLVKWHNVDTVGKTLDAIVQEGGAGNISVSFGLADTKPALGEARTLAVADARAKAQAMASAAGVKVGQVLRISDLSTTARYPAPYSLGAASATTQVPAGQIDVEATVEVDFAIA